FSGNELLELRGRFLYVFYTDGILNSRLTIDLIERKLQTVGTGRNWNTVLKIRDALSQVSRGIG
ncbi:MAG TPA: hypothetical protein VGS41_14105, partial [Chthonomonadales bacterium]|nr:hypothetical protein [Chthonomonadales bacterium]